MHPTNHRPAPRPAIALALTLALGLLEAAQAQVIIPPFVQVTNGIVTLGFSTNSANGLYLSSVGDSLEASAFTCRAADLWQVEFRDPSNGQVTVLGPSDLSSYLLGLTQISSSSLVATWSQCSAQVLPAGVTFNVTVQVQAPPGEKTAELSISVNATLASATALYAVAFPRVEFRERGQSPSTQLLTYPYTGGWLFPDPMHNGTIPANSEAEKSLQHPGQISMQWWSYYDSAESNPANLFLGTRDACGFRKEYILHRLTQAGGGPGVMRFKVRQYPENNVTPVPSASFTSFPSVIGMLRGTWYDAAKLYRTWAVQQPWCAKGPILTNSDFSPLLLAGKMFGSVATAPCNLPSVPAGCEQPWDPNTFDHWTSDLADKKATFGVDSIPTHIYAWDKSSFGGLWGDWLPAQPKFLSNISSYLSLGDPFAPYFLNTNYAAQAPGFPNSGGLPCCSSNPVSTYAVMNPSLQPVFTTENPCLASSPCAMPVPTVIDSYEIDLRTVFARDFTDSISQYLVGVGAKGIYFDTYSIKDTPLSYNPLGGVPGGGCSYTAAKIALIENLRTTMKTQFSIPGFYTYSEGQQEMFIGAYELVYGNFVGNGADVNGAPRLRVAPLFDAVYHDYQLASTVGVISAAEAAGVPASIALMVRQSYAGFLFTGRQPHAGTVLSGMSLGQLSAANPDYGKYVSMITKYMGVLKQANARNYTLYGERMRDPVTTSKTAALPGADPSASGPAWFLPNGVDQPLVYAAVYKRADLNAFAVILVNWTDTGDAIPNLAPGAVPGSQTLSYTVNPLDYGLPAGSYKRSEVVASGFSPLVTVNLQGPTSFNVTVPPLSLRLFVFKKQ